MNENIKHLITVVATGITLILLVFIAGFYYKEVNAVNHGLVEKQELGQAGTYGTKP